MQVSYQARNTTITSSFRQHAQPRIARLSRFFDRISEVRIVVSQQRHWITVEITVDADSALIRGEDRSEEALSSFDKALARVERQLHKYKEKLHRRGRQSRPQPAGAEETASAEAALTTSPDEGDIKIVRTKTHALKPMSPEEAVLQMELLGHDFFVFVNGRTEQVGVVYRRRDGDFGLIEPEIG